MRVLLLGNGMLADAIAGALLDCPRAAFVGLLSSPADRTRLLHERGDQGLRRRLLRAGVRQYLCDGVDRPAFGQRLEGLSPDLVLIANWPERIGAARLAAAPPRWVNCHPSLLPLWRGANPYTAAVLAGDEQSGVSFHVVDEGLDTGNVLLQERVPVHADDTGGDLRQRCAEAAAALLPALLERLADDPDADGTPQSALGEATRCGRLTAADARLDPTEDAARLVRRVHALQPWLQPWLPLRGPLKRLQVTRAEIASTSDEDAAAPAGTVLEVGFGAIRMMAGDGISVRLAGLSAGHTRLPVPAGVAAKLIDTRFPARGD